MISNSSGHIEYSGIHRDFYHTLNIFKHISIFQEITLPDNKELQQIIKVSGQLQITEKKLVRVPSGVSFSGEVLTGLNIIINGYIIVKVDFFSLKASETYSTFNFSIPFSTDLAIDSNITQGMQHLVKGYIVDMYARKITDKSIFFSSNLMITL